MKYQLFLKIELYAQGGEPGDDVPRQFTAAAAAAPIRSLSPEALDDAIGALDEKLKYALLRDKLIDLAGAKP